MKAFMIFRDRVSYAEQCYMSLYDAGLEVHIVDQCSTYPPAREWLHNSPAQVHLLTNRPPQALWHWSGFREIVGPDEPYVVTDCDVVSVAPRDWVAEFEFLLEYYPDRSKIGMALKLDIPTYYRYHREVLDWEQRHWEDLHSQSPIGRQFLYGAPVDTTLAMYQPLNKYPSFSLGPAIRTGYPYVARHLSWYEDSSNPTEEQQYYESHMNRDFSHWIAPERYA